MQILKTEELYNINGGAMKKALLTGLVAIGVLLAGIIDGLFRPLKCHR